MDALRLLKARSGLSYRDIAVRMSRVAPRQAMAKSTLAAFFARDTLPRRPGQLTLIVGILGAELTDSADVAAHYLAAWTQLMTARSALPGKTLKVSGQPDNGAPPRVSVQSRVPPPVTLPARYSAHVSYQPTYRQRCAPVAASVDSRSEYEKAGGLFPLLIGGTILSVLTWLPFVGSGISFWWIWLGWCGPILLVGAVAALFRRPGVSGSGGLPAEYLRYEHRHVAERLPGRY